MTPDVFISHSSRDKAAADAVCAALEAAGVGCWIAPRDIPPGIEWSSAIIGALRQSRLLLLLFTAASNESPQVLREVERAVSLRQPIVTLKLEEATLAPGMEYFISVTHWLSAVGTPLAACLPEVVSAVKGHLHQRAGEAEPPATAEPASSAGFGAHTSVLRGEETTPTNLSARLGDIVGREGEVAAARDLLAGTGAATAAARLVTITGMGGFGKTRLSTEVAHTLLEARPAPFPDGVFAVELAPIADPGLLPQAVAAALSVRAAADGGGPTSVASLTAALKEKRLLLLLDNCEHVLSAAAQLAASLLRECPGVRLLATSRERLGVGGERVLALTPLPLPAGTAPDQVAASAAGSLFLRRAQAVQHGFSLTDANAAAVAEICRRLDGIPLALELAAARVRALSPQQIAQRLDQRFRLLTGGSRDLLPHQQTLRALVDWSYDLLGDVDRALLRRLAAFSGGWTLEAAEAVCSGDGVEDWDVMDSLMSLVDKSLILAGGEGEGGGGAGAMRYRMLETIRQYAREKLDESGEAAATAERHAHFFRHAAEATTSLDALDADGANLRAALDWHIARAQLDGAAAMAVSLKEYWWKRGRVGEGRSVLAHLLERKDELREETRASLLGAAGWLAHLQADYAAADDCQMGSLDLCRAFGDAAGEADALNNLALSALAQGRADEAAVLFEESLAVAERLGDDAKRAARLSNLGMLAAQGGRYDEARARLSDARSLYERLSDRAGAAACLCNLADLALRREEWHEAETLSQESLGLFRELNDAPGIAFSLANLAEAALHAADHADADAVEAYTREALSLSAAAGIHFLLPALADLRARAFAAAGEERSAALCAAAADRLREAMNAPRDVEGPVDAPRRGGGEGAGDAPAARFALLSPEEVVAALLAP